MSQIMINCNKNNISQMAFANIKKIDLYFGEFFENSKILLKFPSVSIVEKTGLKHVATSNAYKHLS